MVLLETCVLVGGGLATALGWKAIQRFKNSQLYQPSAESPHLPADWHRVTLTADDGERLCGWYFRHPMERERVSNAATRQPLLDQNSYCGTVLFCHGNGGNLDSHYTYVRDLIKYFSILIFDYRGYGQSTGQPSERGLVLDALSAWDWLRDVQGIPAHHIIIYGHSLGGAVALQLAAVLGRSSLKVNSHDDPSCCDTFTASSSSSLLLSSSSPKSAVILTDRPTSRASHSAPRSQTADDFSDERPAALILGSTFTSVAEVGPSFIPQWIKRMVASEFRSLDLLNDPRGLPATAQCPIMIYHSQDDEVIPFRHAHSLWSAARQAGHHCSLVEVMGDHCGPLFPSPLHNDNCTSHSLFLINHLRRLLRTHHPTPRSVDTVDQ